MNVLELLEKEGFEVSISERVSQISSHTTGGVEMVFYLNAEKEEQDFKEYVKNFDVDEEIDLHRQDKRYKNDFSIRESIIDFEEYREKIIEIANKIECNMEIEDFERIIEEMGKSEKFSEKDIKMMYEKLPDDEAAEKIICYWYDALFSDFHSNFSVIQKKLKDMGYKLSLDEKWWLVVECGELKFSMEYPKDNRDLLDKIKVVSEVLESEDFNKDLEILEQFYKENYTRAITWDVDDIKRIAGYAGREVTENEAMLILEAALDPWEFDTSRSFDSQVEELIESGEWE